ncbi:MAG: hypothetical protein RRA92_03680 [Gemmatimonadota bacterium]|nr:hypothetical protein [Gemmatimonadota bacterium]
MRFRSGGRTAGLPWRFRALGAAGALLMLSVACGTPDAGGDPDAARLRALADDILPEVETLAGLPARRPVALAVRSRGELEAFLVDELARQLPPERAEGLVRAYARLGLLPADYDLAPLLRSLLLEQVVGYYDPGRDTLYVLRDVESELVEAVLAHEIVHALQDQYQDLDSLTAANLERNDRATAAQAALEGHATLVMLEWQLGRLGLGSDALAALPDLSALGADALIAAAGLEMPALTEAPRILRESLLFPYVGGLSWVQARLRAGEARAAPLGGRMPVSTEQVLHGAAGGPSGTGPHGSPARLAFGAPPDGWDVVYAGDLGELEIRIWLEERLGASASAFSSAAAAAAAAGWHGDAVRLLEGPGGEALVWGTAWDDAAEAREFAAAARRALAAAGDGGAARTRAGRAGGRTGGRVTEVRVATDGPVPLVTVVDQPAGTEAVRFAGPEPVE